ncbi:MAG: lytic transglycosylase domain-containing protein [Minwuia sp.]|nr:lytic transglycosylase domain-containing protein [Minwuia sp.]
MSVRAGLFTRCPIPGKLALLVAVFMGIAPIARAEVPPVPAANPFRAQLQATGELSAADLGIYRAAFATGHRHAWDPVPLMLGPLQDRRLVPVLEWLKIRNGREEDPDAIARFIAAQPALPRQARLAARREEAVLATEDPTRIAAHFATRPALTRAGKLHQALAKRDSDPEGARAIVRDLWQDRDLKQSEEIAVLAAFGDWLTVDDHSARMDLLLWSERRTAAGRMRALLPTNLRLLANARLSLMARRPGVDDAVAAVPPHLVNDPGLLFERTRWRRRAGQHEGAQEILLGNPDMGSRPDLWWVERRIQIRQLIAEGRFDAAWRLARGHGLKRGAAFAQAEFEAGWLALSYLNRPEVALAHFETLYANVAFPVSRARGAYWIARAHRALGNDAQAGNWFRRATMHPTTYYGQMGMLAVGDSRLSLPEAPPVDPSARARFDAEPTVQLVRLLVEVGQNGLARQFLAHLGRGEISTQRRVLLGDLAHRLDRADLQVLAGKMAARDQIILPTIAWPSMVELQTVGAIEPALAHAIARQESAFNPTAISRVGARGLMQLMPATARQVAEEIVVAYQPRRLTDDPRYNALLGSTYLAWQIQEFDGYLPMAIAAYNAGPHRVRRWIVAHGDPRNGEVDPVDWMERIPFSETRNYVQRVLEALQIYRLLNEGGSTLALARDLRAGPQHIGFLD